MSLDSHMKLAPKVDTLPLHHYMSACYVVCWAKSLKYVFKNAIVKHPLKKDKKL